MKSFLIGLLTAAGLSAAVHAAEGGPPAVAHHQHLFSPEMVAHGRAPVVIDAANLLADLDRAGIGRAVVLSTAYSFADDRLGLANARKLVEADNDWTSAQVAPTNGG